MHLDAILKIVQTIPEEDIKYYWKTDLEGANPIAVWIKQCLNHCEIGLNDTQFNVHKTNSTYRTKHRTNQLT